MIQALNMQNMQIGTSNLKQSGRNSSLQKVGFKGAAPTQAIDKIIEKELFNQSKVTKFLSKIAGTLKEENTKTLINAIGTAAVAPIMVIYNPLSKKDKDSRKYSALRQPVSAVVAIIAGVLSGGFFSNYVGQAAKAGKIPVKSLNLSKEFLAKNPTLAKSNQASVDALKAVSGMLVGLIVTPLQAKVLNLLYPPFAKAVAPDLVARIENKKASKKKGGIK